MALKKFDQDLLTRIFRKIVQNYATEDELKAADKRIDDIISEGGEPNVINTVKENGVALEVVDKAVDVTVPTKVSELENDSGFLPYLGTFAGDYNDTSISDGIYQVGATGTTSNSPDSSLSYYTFIQFPTYRTQVILGTGGAEIWIRRYVGSPAEWGDWANYDHVADISNLNNATTDGWYCCSYSSTNAPSKLRGEIFVQVKIYGNYITQTAFSTGSSSVAPGMAVRGRYNSSTWLDWQYPVMEDGGELADTIVTYEDSTGDTISSFTDFINNFVSGTKVGRWFKDFKAGCEYILHVGSLVNNCVTDNANLPLSAAQGKVLMDELTQVKSDLSELDSDISSLSDIKMVRSTTIGDSVSVLDLFNSMPNLTIKWWYCNSDDVTDLPVSGSNHYIMIVRYTETYGSMYAYRMNRDEIYCNTELTTVSWTKIT